jgi:hypothetical protein
MAAMSRAVPTHAATTATSATTSADTIRAKFLLRHSLGMLGNGMGMNMGME